MIEPKVIRFVTKQCDRCRHTATYNLSEPAEAEISKQWGAVSMSFCDSTYGAGYTSDLCPQCAVEVDAFISFTEPTYFNPDNEEVK